MKIGDTAQRTRRITRKDIGLFADMTGDRNPLHFDEDLATQSRFGGIVVQGGVTSGLLNALVAEDLPGPGSVFLHTDLNFRAPVRPGDLLTAHARVTDVRTDKPITTLALSIRNQDDMVVLDGSAVVWRDPVVAAASGHRAASAAAPLSNGSSTAAPEFAGGRLTPREET